MGSKKPLENGSNIEKLLGSSLDRLRTDYVDIYCIEGVNNYNSFHQYKKSILPKLEKLKEKGTIKNIGMTSHDPYIIDIASKTTDIDIYYTPINVLYRHPLTVLKDFKKPLVAMKPFGGWKYYWTQGQDPKYIQDASEFEDWFRPQISLNYLLQFKIIKSILCGFTSKTEIDSALNSVNQKLTEKEKIYYGFDVIDNVCDECGKCECPCGIRIPFLMRLWKYYSMYGITKWTKEVYNHLDADIRYCDNCGLCERVCSKKNIRDILTNLDLNLRDNY